MKLLYTICNTNRKREKRHEMHRQIGTGALDKGNPAALWQIHHFPPSNKCSIISTTSFQNRLGLTASPQRKSKILQKKREKTPQLRIPANPSTLSTLPTATNSDIAKLIFKLQTTLKQKIKHAYSKGSQDWLLLHLRLKWRRCPRWLELLRKTL